MQGAAGEKSPKYCNPTIISSSPTNEYISFITQKYVYKA